MELSDYIVQCCTEAKTAASILAKSSAEQRISALKSIAVQLRSRKSEILSQNEIDMVNARESGLSSAMLDRLKLDDKRIELMASSIEQIANQPEIVGSIEDEHIRFFLSSFGIFQRSCRLI